MRGAEGQYLPVVHSFQGEQRQGAPEAASLTTMLTRPFLNTSKSFQAAHKVPLLPEVTDQETE